MSIILEQEKKTYDRHKMELFRDHPNGYVLIKGDEVIGIYNTEQEAKLEASKRFDINDIFLIRQITQVEKVINYTPRKIFIRAHN